MYQIPQLNYNRIDIATRVTIAHSQITVLRELFNCRDVSIETKIIMCQAIHLNMALWGCETWALKDKESKKLDALHHTAMSGILGISTRRVREERIANKMVSSKLMGIPPTSSYYATCITIGETVRNPS
jgi:hypothetical protein